jgi:MFS family permease
MEASNGSLCRDKSYLMLLVLVFFMHLAAYLVIPVLPIFLQKARALSLSQVGFLLGAGSITYQIGSLIGGPMSDRLGRRSIIMIGALLQGSAMIGYHFSVGYGLFLLFASVNGLGLGLLAPTIKAMIADEVDPAQRTSAFSWRGILAHSGIIVAGLLISWMTSTGTRPFLPAGLVFITLAAFIRFGLPDDRCVGPQCQRTPLTEYKHILTHRSFLLFSLITLLIWALYAQFTLILPLRGEHVLHSATLIGLIWTINSISVVLFQGLISRFVLQRINPYLSLAAGTTLLGAGLSLMGWTEQFVTLSGAAILFILGEMLFMPVQDSLVTHFAQEEWLGAYFGFSNFVSGIGTALGTSIGGAMVERLGGVGSPYPWVAYGISTVFFTAILGLFAIYAMSRHKQTAPSARQATRGKKEGST